MAVTSTDAEPYLAQLKKLNEDASYSAQSYFEAAKSAEVWGRAIVFVPAVLGAVLRKTKVSRLILASLIMLGCRPASGPRRTRGRSRDTS